jgi:type II secretory pathway component PulJ
MAPRGLRSSEAGFTLSEFLVGIAVVALIMGGLLWLLTGGQRSYLQGSNQVEAQQSARIALEQMIREIRGSGYNPGNAAFTAITGQSTTGFILQNDWNGNGVIEPTITVTVGGATRGERVTYSVTSNRLDRQESAVDASPVTVARIEQVTFQYLDANNVVTATSANIRTVVVTIRTRPQDQPATAMQGRAIVAMTDRARLRNR